MTLPVTTSGTLNSYRRRKEARRVIELEMDAENRARMHVPGKKFSAVYTEHDVADYTARMIEVLDRIRRDVKNLGKDAKQPLAQGDAYLKELRDVGVQAYARLPKGLGEYLGLIEAEEGQRGISLDFTFPAPMSFIWEMIYYGEPFGPPAPDKFWGFRYPIGRVYEEYYMRDLVQLQKGVFASAHHALACSKDELEQLRRKMMILRERMRLLVEFQRLEEAISCEGLSSEALLALFNGDQFDYGVVHFACHCVNPDPDTIYAGASRAYLKFTVEQREVAMTVGEFDAWASFNRRFHSRPLVFLNACESATPLHLQSLSLPTVLLNFGASGVIATVCTMPDNFASAFATEFYGRLLDKYIAATETNDPAALVDVLETPSYIGEALLETRRHFWAAYRNPLGLAYGLYARSDQRLLLMD